MYSQTRFIPIRRASAIMNTTDAMATIDKSADNTQSTAVPNHAAAYSWPDMTAIPLNTIAVTNPMAAKVRNIHMRIRDSRFMTEDYAERMLVGRFQSEPFHPQ